MRNNSYLSDTIIFENLSKKEMSFDNVYEHIKKFIQQEPTAHYKLMLGTDSQVHNGYTTFITGVIIHRVGKGAWGCYREVQYEREISNLKEKISTETSLTEEVAFLFSLEKKDELVNLVLPNIYEGAALDIEGHIDIGKEKRNLTRFLVDEMVNRIESLGLEPKIKPDSLAASGYANRYTK